MKSIITNHPYAAMFLAFVLVSYILFQIFDQLLNAGLIKGH